VENLLYASFMFLSAAVFVGGDLTRWNTSRMTNADCMFCFSEMFNGNVSTWDVSRVTSFAQTFQQCKIFNGDVSMWDTSNAVNMKQMFGDAISFSSNLSSWKTSKLEVATEMVSYYCPLYLVQLALSSRPVLHRGVSLFCSFWAVTCSTVICPIGMFQGYINVPCSRRFQSEPLFMGFPAS
jgi:Mycoplasma protein of unknown function, DUF285